jgi:signal transduction histidine kinase
VGRPVSAYSWLLTGCRTQGLRDDGYAIAWLAAVSLPLMALVLSVPGMGFSSESGNAVLQTIGGAAALLAAAVVVQRFRAVPTRRSHALAFALVFGGVTTMTLASAPAMLNLSVGAESRAATDMVALTMAGLLAWAGCSGELTADRSVRPGRPLTGGLALAALVVGLGVALGSLWPASFESVTSSGEAQLSPAVLVIDLAAVLLLAVAAIGFAVRAHAPGRDLFAFWLAVSATLSLWARIDFALAPRSASNWVAVHGVLSVASLIALAIGAVRELDRARGSERESEREIAVKQERRRLARELHDNVAQELAFIVCQTHELARQFPEQSALAHIGAAAKLALDGSRSTIYGLHTSTTPTLGSAVQERAHVLAARAGLELALEIHDDVVSSPEVQHAVLSILQEAISNAARHGGASKLAIALSTSANKIRVRISDDGCGFEPEWREPSTDGGFGLWTMRERVEALGGQLQLTSSPGDGTAIELAFSQTARELSSRSHRVLVAGANDSARRPVSANPA